MKSNPTPAPMPSFLEAYEDLEVSRQDSNLVSRLPPIQRKN